MVKSGPGERFARAIAARDGEVLRSLLRADVDFRGMTPKRFWVAMSSAKVIDEILLGSWFAADDVINEIELLECDAVADRHRVSYRFLLTNASGRYAVEQHAFFDMQRGQITWLRIMCSGYRRVREVSVPASRPRAPAADRPAPPARAFDLS